MPRTILGLETRACINGLNKTDFENVKQIPILESETNEIKNTTIPALDERVTALEQGGSGGSEWTELDVSTYNKAHAQVNTLFDYDGDHYFTKKDMILIYKNKMFYIDSGTGVDVSTARKFQYMEINYNSQSTTQVTQITEDVTLYNIFLNSSVTGTEFRCPACNLIFKNDNTITINSYPSGIMFRNRLRVFIKG